MTDPPSRREIVTQNLTSTIARLDAVMRPWGFTFVFEKQMSSHIGPFASGHYVRGATRIGLSCRDSIDNLYYEHCFVTKHRSYQETERFTLWHPGLMKTLGHAQDCHLIGTDEIYDSIAARDGGDRVAALLLDWIELAAPILSSPCDAFDEAMRHGARSYTVE